MLEQKRLTTIEINVRNVKTIRLLKNVCYTKLGKTGILIKFVKLLVRTNVSDINVDAIEKLLQSTRRLLGYFTRLKSPSLQSLHSRQLNLEITFNHPKTSHIAELNWSELVAAPSQQFSTCSEQLSSRPCEQGLKEYNINLSTALASASLRQMC